MKDEIKEIILDDLRLKDIRYHECKEKDLSFNTEDYQAHLLLDYITNLQEENEELKAELQEANDSATWWSNRFKAVERENKRLLKTQEMYEKKCNKIHQYITQNCEIIRHKDYDEIGKVNGRYILFLLNGGDEE